MYRDGDLIFFEDDDKVRYPRLPPFMPVEAAPGLFEDILHAQLANKAKIQMLHGLDVIDRNYAEYLTELQQTHVTSVRLQAVAEMLCELAGAELIEAMLPAPS